MLKPGVVWDNSIVETRGCKEIIVLWKPGVVVTNGEGQKDTEEDNFQSWDWGEIKEVWTVLWSILFGFSPNTTHKDIIIYCSVWCKCFRKYTPGRREDRRLGYLSILTRGMKNVDVARDTWKLHFLTSFGLWFSYMCFHTFRQNRIWCNL